MLFASIVKIKKRYHKTSKNDIKKVKRVQKLIFINVGVYGRSMNYFQILNHHRVKEFIKVKEHLLGGV